MLDTVQGPYKIEITNVTKHDFTTKLTHWRGVVTGVGNFIRKDGTKFTLPTTVHVYTSKNKKAVEKELQALVKCIEQTDSLARG